MHLLLRRRRVVVTRIAISSSLATSLELRLAHSQSYQVFDEVLKDLRAREAVVIAISSADPVNDTGSVWKVPDLMRLVELHDQKIYRSLVRLMHHWGCG